MEQIPYFEEIEESGIILVLSEPGTGKTSLLMAILKHLYFTRGKIRLKKCRQMLEELNKNRKIPFELPTEPPFYTSRDCPARFKVGYEKWYEPYMLNPYYIGVNSYADAQFILPYGVAVIPELQKYTNSRRGQSLQERFYREFEIYRHWHLLFLVDGHKGSFIDLRVRALTKHVIEIQKQVHERDGMGRILKTTWYCREFYSMKDYDDYILHNAATYRETKYENDGNIFECYDSFSCKDEFIPPEGKSFSMLKPLSQSEIKKLPPETAKYYSFEEPAAFRGKEEKKAEPKSGKKAKKSKEEGNDGKT